MREWEIKTATTSNFARGLFNEGWEPFSIGYHLFQGKLSSVCLWFRKNQEEMLKLASETKCIWGIKRAVSEEKAEKLLNDGWEPFSEGNAMVGNTVATTYLWFKKKDVELEITALKKIFNED